MQNRSELRRRHSAPILRPSAGGSAAPFSSRLLTSMAHIHTKVLILGSGPAGLTAAIYAARANLHPVIVAGMQPGGQMTITSDVENYPGFPDVVQGPWLMEQMQKQAEHVGTKIITDHVNDLDLSGRPVRLSWD